MSQDQVINLIQKVLTAVGSGAAALGFGAHINWVGISGLICTIFTFIWSHQWNAPTPATTTIPSK